jgi:hypothetical protein|nr:MAG TPA: hypothetical protein [Caudoviricetes sp.]
MPRFNWSASRLARLRSAVRAFNAAITRREHELDDEGQSILKGYLPSRVTVEGIMSRVHSVNDFRRIVGYKSDRKHGRYSELTRVLKSVNRDALDITTDNLGRLTTKYSERQYKLDMRAIRRQRKKTLEAISQEFFEGDDSYDMKSLSPAKYGTLTTDNDLMPEDEGEFDDSYTDVDSDTLKRWEQEDASRKREQVAPDAMYEVYRSTWTATDNHHSDMAGYQELIDALDWMADNATAYINKLFALGYDELDPSYISESGGESNPYVNTPYETRHNRAVRFVADRARKVGYEG